MELDFEPLTIGLTAGFYIACLGLIWYLNAGMVTWDMPIKTKIMLSVAMLPLCYGMIVWQKNR